MNSTDGQMFVTDFQDALWIISNHTVFFFFFYTNLVYAAVLKAKVILIISHIVNFSMQLYTHCYVNYLYLKKIVLNHVKAK